MWWDNEMKFFALIAPRSPNGSAAGRDPNDPIPMGSLTPVPGGP